MRPKTPSPKNLNGSWETHSKSRGVSTLKISGSPLSRSQILFKTREAVPKTRCYHHRQTEQNSARHQMQFLPSPETQGETIEAICQNPPFLPFTASQAAAIAWVPLLKDIITAPPVSYPLGNVTLPKRSEVVKTFTLSVEGKP